MPIKRRDWVAKAIKSICKAVVYKDKKKDYTRKPKHRNVRSADDLT